MPNRIKQLLEDTPSRPIDVSDILMQVLSPELHAKMQMEFYKQRYPSRIKNDYGPGYSGIEDRLLTKSPGVVKAIIDRTDLFAAEAEAGPASGAELDKIIMDFANVNAQSIKNLKGSM